MSLDISDFSFLRKNWNPPENFTPSFALTPLKIEVPFFLEYLVGGSTLPRRKGGSHYEIMVNLKKITKEKLTSYEGMYAMSMYTMSDGKK